MLKSGLTSISFRAYTPEVIIKFAKSAGLDFIEWGSDVHAPCDDVDRLNLISRLQAKHKIACSSYGTYFKMGADDPQAIMPYISAARLLGTSVLRIWCGTKASDLYTQSERSALLNEACVLAKVAEQESVTLCLEYHPNTFTDCAEAAMQMMQAANSSNFKMYWQPNQFKTIDQNLFEAKELSDYVQNIHVFNWDNTNRRYPLENSVNLWRQYAACFKGEHCMLLEFMPDDKIESLMTEADALFKVIKR